MTIQQLIPLKVELGGKRIVVREVETFFVDGVEFGVDELPIMVVISSNKEETGIILDLNTLGTRMGQAGLANEFVCGGRLAWVKTPKLGFVLEEVSNLMRNVGLDRM